MKRGDIHIVKVICKTCACLLVALLLLIPLTESLHTHQEKFDYNQTDDVSIKDHHQKCSVCDYLTNVHNHQLNYAEDWIFVCYNQSLPLVLIQHTLQHADGFILSCANKGPPAISVNKFPHLQS